MLSIKWQNLRSWNGSQYAAFEELCCQLAFYEKEIPVGSVFTRKGTPDAGVECFWKSPCLDEFAWQTKFFSSVDKSQWKQLDESVETALYKHPHLIRYTVCIPIDRQDPRMKDRQSFMDKWNEHVEKWQKWAQNKGMSVSFPYWGEHEIFERLTREEHQGRHLFWFNSELFNKHWFQSRLEEAIANAGPRYSPELNVELPIARLFDGLGRTSKFFNRFKSLREKIKKISSGATHKEKNLSEKDFFESLQQKIAQLLLNLQNLNPVSVAILDFTTLSTLASECREQAYDYIRFLKQIRAEQRVDNQQSIDSNYQPYELNELIEHLYSLEELAESNASLLSNVSALLLRGNAGSGKTHLLCDVAQNRIHSSSPTILLLGEQFNDAEPWSQITGLLGLSCKKEELLGALEAAAQSKQTKALILIDAVNEGAGKKIWKKHIAGILKTLTNFPHLGIAISVRTPYEDVVIPQHLDQNYLVRETHYGFAQREYQATRTFFDFFGIKRPSIPLLNPEFQNPLFLKLFCLGLKNRGLTEIPTGFHGISSVFEFLIDSVNTKLSSEQFLNFDEYSEIVQKAVQQLFEAMAKMIVKNNRHWLPREDAQNIINALLPSKGYHDSLFNHLLIEGIIAEDIFWQGDEKRMDGIRFSYERFSDHLVVKYLLDNYLDLNNPSAAFLPTSQLGILLKDYRTCNDNRGLLEAFSIQIPERIGRELVEVAPHCASYSIVREAFIQSLIWRDPSSINDLTCQYMSSQITQDDKNHAFLLNTFLTVASNVKHPYNADFLHNYLKRDSRADRDAWWSTFLHSQYDRHEAVDRLVDWAWTAEDKSYIDDEAIRLCSIALTWFLTTSNRFLRDRATKALVSLLTPHIHILRQVILKFLDIDDLYILERLYCVAYGCAMRSTNDNDLAELAQDVYDWVFKSGEPIPHILLRDYARGVIELALSRNIELKIDVARIRPPYKSEWINNVLSREELEIYTDEANTILKKHNYASNPEINCWRSIFSIEHSVLDRGDFACYIIGTNSSSFSWTSQRLDEPPTSEEIYEKFLKSLTERQKKAWDRYQTTLINVENYRQMSLEQRIEEFEFKFTEQELEEFIFKEICSFRKTLGSKKIKIFEEYILDYSENLVENEHQFDLDIAQRWIFWRVFDLGWTVERFGWFDSSLGSSGRIPNKAERIGKKYQWLAYHEFLARVSDNFKFKLNNWNSTDGNGYCGPWQDNERDIDPSCLLKSACLEDLNKQNTHEWFSVSYDLWNTSDNINWLKCIEDLPDIKLLIDVINPINNSSWLALENYRSWTESASNDEEQLSQKQIWYMTKSYLVEKQDIDLVFDWAIQQDFMGRWMPESHELTQMFLGEFFWSPAFKYHNTPYFSHDGWITGGMKEIPRKILVTTDKYLQESSGVDCSIDESYILNLPAQLLADGMELCWNGMEGSFFDRSGRLIAFDPSVKEVDFQTCLINRDVLINFLDQSNLDIFWTFLGEKIILEGTPYRARLDLSGALRLKHGQLEGTINFKLNFLNNDKAELYKPYIGKFSISSNT
jgi:Fe-S cluster biosynthesis and repair protein YggX